MPSFERDPIEKLSSLVPIVIEQTVEPHLRTASIP